MACSWIITILAFVSVSINVNSCTGLCCVQVKFSHSGASLLLPGCTCAAVQVAVPSQHCGIGWWEGKRSSTEDSRP